MDGTVTTLARLVLVAALSLPAGEASAVSARPDGPALSDPSIGEQEADLATRRANPPTFMPSTAPTLRVPIPGNPHTGEIAAGLRASEIGVPTGRLYAEGSFLVRRAGVMLQAPSGEWIFIFNPSQSGEMDVPMVLAPSAELDHVLPMIAQDALPRQLTLTGQVLVYAGRNYLIPLSIIDSPPPTNPPTAPDQTVPDVPLDSGETAPTPPARTARELADDPDVSSLIADLEARRNVPRGLAPRAAAPAPMREGLLSQTSIQTIPEGTMLVRRRARMVREPSGAWVLTLDNDSGRDAARLIVLPCQNLTAMERLASGLTEEAQFEVTARVLTFQGRNYALPLLYSLLRSSDVRGLQ